MLNTIVTAQPQPQPQPRPNSTSTQVGVDKVISWTTNHPTPQHRKLFFGYATLFWPNWKDDLKKAKKLEDVLKYNKKNQP